jgi:HSP20 family protein
MSGLMKLWKDPFFTDVMDIFNETPMFVDRSFRRSNIITNEKDYRIQVAVPGLTKEDVKISVDNSIIKISHEKKETDNETFFFTNSFQKSYQLPDDIEDDKIEGKIENGILEIIIPRSKKKIKEKFIEIK